MLLPMISFSLSALTDPTRHVDHARLYQMELLPEIMALPGVAWSERWARTPDCIAPGDDSALAATQYADLVFFRAPVEDSIRAHQEAGERLAQRGLRPDLGWASTLFQAFFVPLKAYVLPRVLIASEIVPFRPARGLYAIVSEFRTHDAAAEAAFRWYDDVRIPDLLTCHGAAGAWSLVTEKLYRPERDLSQPALRLVLVWLDGDPAAFVADLDRQTPDWRGRGRLPDHSEIENILFAGPLRTIVPWRWDQTDPAPRR